jgi:hypothetical protein
VIFKIIIEYEKSLLNFDIMIVLKTTYKCKKYYVKKKKKCNRYIPQNLTKISNGKTGKRPRLQAYNLLEHF